MAGYDEFEASFRRNARLEELLAGDVTRAVMLADHVGMTEVRRLCRAVGAMLEQRAGGRGPRQRSQKFASLL